METRKETLNALKLCRFCLTQNETLTTLYDRRRAPKNAVPLPLKILSCVSIEVYPSDRMPSYICSRCKFFMEMSYEFKQLCRQADENVLEYVQTGTDLSSVPWPLSLQKLYKAATKSAPEMPIMKTIVEGGATIQVTAQDYDSEEDDDENVYNIKIGDGSEEGEKSARVKVITADNQTKAKVKPSKGFSTVSKLTRHVRSHAGDRAYPCKHCDKSFMKSHHYTRHLRVKHRNINRNARDDATESYRCEQCEDSFATQDELIYHSAIHATQNLICPLCQEKFEDVDAVTAHIKSHVNGMEFMCDLCELVFTSKDKLDNHVLYAHMDELQNEEMDQEESSNEMEVDDDEDDTGINVKEEDGHMVVEIKKPDGFMLPTLQDEVEEKNDNINSEESESEIYTELPNEDTVSITNKEPIKVVHEKTSTESPRGAVISKIVPVPTKTPNNTDNQGAAIIKKVVEVKRDTESIAEKKINKVESNNTSANDKSLRLLEKELQELKRTNTRTDVVKISVKPVDPPRNKRLQIHTSTPKTRPSAVEERKIAVSTKSPSLEKQKQPEKRIVTKENKEPKEIKETKGNSSIKEDKEKDNKEVKGKETPKIIQSQVKNTLNEKTAPEEGIRRSTRPSKIKDYAKMIRDRTQDTDEEEDSDEVDEEYKETEKSVENKPKTRRPSVKPSPKPTPVSVTPSPTPRKRGRPRKDTQAQPTPPKVKKEDNDTTENMKLEVGKKQNEVNKKEESTTPVEQTKDNATNKANNGTPEKKPTMEGDAATGVLVSPTGQTLKKIPVQALPPGLLPPGKTLPLPNNARLIGAGKPCKMQLGKKLVNVQKIVVTKAEVEAMTKKGLLQMKDGTMVLKQGVKLPTSESKIIQPVDDALKESPKKPKGAPTRCDIDEDV